MSASDPALVSLIIRTKNEERWIHACLRGVFSQTYRNIEVIIVDNGSTDRTLMRAQEFPVRVVHIDEFLPGKAINDGIRASTGSVLVCLSGHCIPVSDTWLEHLVRDLGTPDVAGVYGRQEPLSFTSDFDKRDLITVFGLDRKVQIKDSFFHNANSAFRREVWERFPFDEVVTNIEDRVWGQQVIAAGMRIVYEPQASVYHWHGIHQGLNPERARKVARILESLQPASPREPHGSPEHLKTVAIVPVRGRSRALNDTTLLDYTIRVARSARFISDVVVATDVEDTAALARSLGARVPFLRPADLSADYVDVADVFRYALERIENLDGVPDLVVMLEETYPFRTATMLDEMIARLVSEGLDTVIAARKETRGIWMQQEGEAVLLADGFMPRQFKRQHAMVGLLGLGCVTHPMFLRAGTMFDGKVGIFEVDHPLSAVEVRDAATQELAEQLAHGWWKDHAADARERK
jgi:CMP-N-acetylneuraminic acid synthetase/GT2 family glycosyltransferase